MKIVIIGSGKVGQMLTQQLERENHDVTVIDISGEVLGALSSHTDVMCIHGNAVDYSVMMEAGIPQADLVIACTETDELNMLCCLLAKKHGAARTIARVRNPEYYEQLPYIEEDMGLSMAINPEEAAARVISRVLLFPAANSIEVFAKGRVELIELPLHSGNPLIGKSLSAINATYPFRILICGIARGDDTLIPTGSDVLQEDDHIFIASSHDQLELFFKTIDLFRTSVKTVMIVGGGRIAFYLARQLLHQGMHVKIIEQKPDRCQKLCAQLPKASIIHGDGTDEDLLTEEGLDTTDALIAATGMDEINVILSLYARARKVQKIVTKVTQLSFTEMLKRIGVDTIVSPKHITAAAILRYVRALDASQGSSVESLSRLADGRIEALEFMLERAPFLGTPLRNLPIRSGFLVACIVRAGKLIFPSGNDTLEKGDSVMIVTTHPHIHAIEEIFA